MCKLRRSHAGMIVLVAIEWPPAKKLERAKTGELAS
jgi:hypothetical protein